MKRYPLACFLLLTSCMAGAGEYHVSIKAGAAGDGSATKPFRTISEAAQVARPGDVITVHEGTYRERIDPPRGGESDEKRITYQLAPGEKVVLTGAEPVKGWTKVTNDTWQVTIPNTFFGGFNPYTDRIKGDWCRNPGGYHTVRHNTISHCEQAGIVGSMGCSFSTITDNEIHDIHVRRFVQGEEMGGIKFHGAINTLIARNHIYRCNRGIWLDWMAQGTRVTSNLLHDNASASVDWPAKWEANVSGGEQDLFLEVNHGPIIVDNNICLSTYSLNNRSQGVLFAHNLFAGSFRIVAHDKRMTPYLKPHSTETAQLHDNPCGDNHFYNNIFVQRCDLTGFDSAKLPNSMEGNVFVRGTKPSKLEAHPLVLDKVTTELLLQQKPDGWFLIILPQEAWETRKRPQVSTDLLGKAVISGMNYLNPDGSRLAVDADYFGKARDVSNPFPGPFNPTLQAGNAVKVWPR